RRTIDVEIFIRPADLRIDHPREQKRPEITRMVIVIMRDEHMMQIVQIHIILHMRGHPAPRIKEDAKAVLLYQVARSRRIPLRKTTPHADDRTLHHIHSISFYSSSTLISGDKLHISYRNIIC